MTEKIIQFPGARRGDVEVAEGQRKNGPLPEKVKDPLEGLSEDQRKAIGLIFGGATFILVALKPTPTGCDFYTALHGDHADLRNAHGELPAVIDRLYARKQIE